MLRKVELTNYRGFAAFQADLSDVTVLIGKNSSGKSTVLQAIRLACESLAQTAAFLPERVPDGWIWTSRKEVVSDPSALVGLSDWTQLFHHAQVGDGTSLDITLAFDETDALQELWVSFHYGRNRQLLRSVAVRSRQALASVSGMARKSDVKARLQMDLGRLYPLSVFVPAFYGVIRTEEHRSRPLLTRLLGSGDQSHIVRNLVARLDAADLEQLNRTLLAPLGTRLTRRTAQADAENTADLHVYFQDDNGELELSSAGSGLVNLVALFSAMKLLQVQRVESENRPVLFLLDEPEAHLHPRLQAEAAEALTQLALHTFGVQLVLATHSVEVTNRLGQRRDAVLLHVDRKATPSVAVLRNDSDIVAALGSFCDLTPFTALNFLASRRVLFYEGPSDYKFLRACARLLYADQQDRWQRFLDYTPVPLNGVGNASAQGVLKALLTPALFPTLQSGVPVRAALVKDRDFGRQPKAPTSTNLANHLVVVEATWSRHSIESLFLDSRCLSAWLAPHIRLAPEDLVTQLDAAVKKADEDRALEDQAVDGRRAVHRRPDKDGKMLDENTANQRARADVRENPAVFQHGKDRSRVLLQALRDTLPKGSFALRGSLVEIVEQAERNLLPDLHRAIPLEIRTLLDLLTAP
jgi:energy-coupling factor transporter ATP-binding protein EcfA2